MIKYLIGSEFQTKKVLNLIELIERSCQNCSVISEKTPNFFKKYEWLDYIFLSKAARSTE